MSATAPDARDGPASGSTSDRAARRQGAHARPGAGAISDRIRPCPIGTPFHPRTLPLCESLNYREWAGYYAVSAYQAHHEHEYNAIRNAAALIDVSPLYKYLVSRPGCRRGSSIASSRATPRRSPSAR